MSALALAMTASAYFSYKQNITGDKLWFFLTWVITCVPLWAIVSRYSKNLVLDATLFDVLVVVVFFFALAHFTGQLHTLRWFQYLGFGMIVAGSILMKIGYQH